jgi:uncharacterized protein
MTSNSPQLTPATWTVAVGDQDRQTTTVAFDPAPAPISDAVIIFGHGASSHLAHKTVLGLCAALRDAGLHTVRYNFLYTEHKTGPPDRMPKLILCLAAVAQSVQERLNLSLLFAGGHSMGGRAASVMAAEQNPFHGLILCGYPLHPAGQPEKLRSEHLPHIAIPTLCCNGTRDELCRRDLMDPIVATLPQWTMHWIEAADHSFHVQKKSGRTEEDVHQEFAQTVRQWLHDYKFAARPPVDEKLGTVIAQEEH